MQLMDEIRELESQLNARKDEAKEKVGAYLTEVFGKAGVIEKGAKKLLAAKPDEAATTLLNQVIALCVSTRNTGMVLMGYPVPSAD